jgi:nucleoside-diphosphate-sugar epimerase
VKDISRAFLAALEAPRETVHDQAFNVGRDEDVLQIRTVAEQVSEITGAPVTFAPGAGADARNYRVEFSKIRALLPAATPRWTVPDGIRELWAHASERGLTPEDFEHRFVRLARVRDLAAAGALGLADLRTTAVPA